MADYKWYTVRIPIEVGSDLDKRINTFTVIVDVEANPGLMPTAEGYYNVRGSLPETAISYGTADLTAGTSPLATGSLYLVYE